MRKKYWLSGLLILTCGCTGMEHTDNGMATGGVVGGLTGLGVGLLTRNPAAGLAIGAGSGALAGAAIGNKLDRDERRAEAQAAQAYAAAHPPLALQDIVRMTHQHVGNNLIIQQIRSTNSVYNLTPDEIIWLRQQGVSDSVITEMQSRRAVLVRPVRAVCPPPPPPIGFGIGISNAGPCPPPW